MSTSVWTAGGMWVADRGMLPSLLHDGDRDVKRS